MHLTLDFESRSDLPLKECGMYRYSEGENTDIMCLAIKKDNEAPVLWVPEYFKHLVGVWADTYIITDYALRLLIEEATTIEAQNCGFERCLWREIMHKRYGFPDLPLEKLKCSAALAASYALPRSLGQACYALGLPQQKDVIGSKVMMKMCKPRKALARERKDRTAKGFVQLDNNKWRNSADNSEFYLWHEDPNDFKILCLYCMQDVEAERSLSEALRPLSEYEQKLWIVDQKINDRGVLIDLEAVASLKNKIKYKENKLLLETQQITGGVITSTRQNAKTMEWLATQGVDTPNMQKETVEELLEIDIPDNVRRLLTIRQSLSKSSVSKLDAMEAMACRDGRVRGALMFNGASTARWTARGLQVHNFPRESFNDEEIQWVISSGVKAIDEKYGCMFYAASKCLRGMMVAPEGKNYRAVDFSSIEARVLAWLANEEWKLKAYNNGIDTYKLEASKVFGVAYDDVTKKQRQVGKVEELAFGYQGWADAFQSMAKNHGIKVSDEQAAKYAAVWRANNPRIVLFWKGMENAAIETIKTGKPHSFGRIKFGMREGFLHMRLPSGRLLSYYSPYTRKTIDKFDREKISIFFKGTEDKGWGIKQTYGGKLTENCVQAIARDLLANALMKLDAKGYSIPLHVHDEIVDESESEDLTEFKSIMLDLPDWAKDIPMGADGYVAKRYRKG